MKKLYNTTALFALFASTALATLCLPSAAKANGCILDSNDDGTATNGIDSDGGAQSGGQNSGDLACGRNATVSGSNGTSIGVSSKSAGIDSTAVGFDSTATRNFTTSIGARSNATANGSTSVGTSALATADGSTAVGAFSAANGVNSSAVGFNSRANADNSVALGAQSVANVANTVSVGNADQTFGPVFQRRIVNVAAGTGTFDAVNIGQLNAVVSAQSAVDAGQNTRLTALEALNLNAGSQIANLQTGLAATNFDLRTLRTEARRGVASAMAMTNAPFPSAPGKVSYAANTAIYRGEVAGSVSLSYRINSSDPMALSAGVSYAGPGEFGARVGIAGEF